MQENDIIKYILQLQNTLGVSYFTEKFTNTIPQVITTKEILQKPVTKKSEYPQDILQSSRQNLTYEKGNTKNLLVQLKNCLTIADILALAQNLDEVSIKKYAQSTIIGEGNKNAKLMLIGEAPGKEEDEVGKPFIGKSGKLLIKAFKSIGITREEMFITNSVFWRPPGNATPKEQDILLCLPFIYKLFEIIDPRIIILVGKTACISILSYKKAMTHILGKWHKTDKLSNRILRVIYHPAYLLRDASKKEILWLDLLDIKKSYLSLNSKDI